MHPAIIEIASAAEFINRLRRSSPEWLEEGQMACHWVFRGHADSSWPLTPSASRDQTKHPIWKHVEKEMEQEGTEASWRKYAGWSNDTRYRHLVLQLRFERMVVVLFSQLADELGFRIPGDNFPTYDISSALERLQHIRTFQESFDQCYALAQHHGMPTRLLDWTKNPLTAAFFATDNIDIPCSDQIAVWAFATHRRGRRRHLQFFTVPRSGAGYLHAQDGLFSYLIDAERPFHDTGAWPSHIDEMPEGSLRKLTLPRSEVPELKRLLWIERISKAHLMPTFDNVVKALHNVMNTPDLYPQKAPVLETDRMS